MPEVQEEKWEALGEGVGLFTDAAHRFGEDALLLADFARPRPGERCCDLGTGGGIIPFQWLAQGANNVIDGIDLDPEAIALARRSAALTARERQLAFHLADWRQLDRVLPAGEYGLTVCNPPYFPPGSGKVSRKDAAARARHEPSPDTLSRLAEAAARLLKKGGRFCLCHRPERLCDVLAALRAAGLEPKCLRLVQRGEDRPPWLLLCEAHKGGRPGLKIMPSLLQREKAKKDMDKEAAP